MFYTASRFNDEDNLKFQSNSNLTVINVDDSVQEQSIWIHLKSQVLDLADFHNKCKIIDLYFWRFLIVKYF